MNSSPIHSLFTPPTEPHTKPSLFLLSVLVHGVVVLGAVALMHTPSVRQLPVARRYTTLVVKLQRDTPKLQWVPSGDTAHPSLAAKRHAGGPPAVFAATVASQPQPQPQSRIPAPMTLIQPEIPPNMLLPVDTPIPMIALWTPPSRPVLTIVPPPSQPQTAPDVHPSLAMPNHELRSAAIELSSSAAPSETIPLLAGTTAPIPGPGLDPSQVPQSSSHSLSQPAPKAVLSVSDVVLPEGAVTLPPANQMAGTLGADSFAPEVLNRTAAAGDRPGVSNPNGGAAGAASGEHGKQNEAATGSGFEGKGVAAVPASGADAGSDPAAALDNGPAFDRITRPRDGHFGVVVVGDSVAEEYPEAAGVLTGRLAYTVYLQVGQTKNWILQYCLPRTAQAAGNTTRPDAPWPYLMVTPHLTPGDYDADALLVHGFIDATGHFEQLAVVFPAEFAQSKFVLAALQQWQFRAAAQNGQAIAVEVLLIIPEVDE